MIKDLLYSPVVLLKKVVDVFKQLGYMVYLIVQNLGEILYYLSKFVVVLLRALLIYIGGIIHAILRPIFYLFGLKVPGSRAFLHLLFWVVGFIQSVFLYLLTIAIPLANLFIWKSNIKQQKKFIYVSVVTILLGFIMVLIEINQVYSFFGLSSSINDYYLDRPTQDMMKANQDPFYRSLEDYDMSLDSRGLFVNLQRVLTNPNSQTVVEMPDSMMRQLGVVKTIKNQGL